MTTMVRFEGRIHQALNPVSRVYVDSEEVLGFMDEVDTANHTLIALKIDEYGNPITYSPDKTLFYDEWMWEQKMGEIKIFLSKEVLTNKRCIRNKLFERSKA